MLNTLNTTFSFHFLKCNNNADRFVRLYACTHMHIIRNVLIQLILPQWNAGYKIACEPAESFHFRIMGTLSNVNA